MKILFFADLHADMNAIKNLKNRSYDVDLSVCAGDLTTMESGLKTVVKELANFNSPVILIHGNHEDERGLKELSEKYDNLTFLHKAIHKMDDYLFMGYGGDGFSASDPQFENVAKEFFKPHSKNSKKLILITHGPAFDSGIDNMGGSSRGNKSYKKFIDDVKPHIAVSGHLHENAGKKHISGRTLFLNPGKEGVVVEI